MSRAGALAGILLLVAGCGRTPTEPGPPSTSPVSIPAPAPAADSPDAGPSTSDLSAGSYQLRIETAATSCGGLFSQPLVFDGDLVRDAGEFTFGRNVHLRSHHYKDRLFLRFRLDGHRVSGDVTFDETLATSPTGLELDNQASDHHRTTGELHLDGTVTGVFPHTMKLVDVSSSRPPRRREYCRADFAWTLTKR